MQRPPAVPGILVGPLAHLLDGTRLESMDLEEARQTVTDALQLLGNANSQISRLRRKRILKSCNPDFANLADRADLFTQAAPHLFGDGFEAKMKERAEAVRVLQKSSKPYQQTQSRFFQSNRPQRGGGQNYRGGRGRGSRYNPRQQRDFQGKNKN